MLPLSAMAVGGGGLLIARRRRNRLRSWRRRAGTGEARAGSSPGASWRGTANCGNGRWTVG